MPIVQLPAVVINQIAAGEVVERPASVVKEVLENAIDAGASRVEILIEGGGVDLIEVIDDGCGMSEDELPLAIASHATSKVSALEDLEHIATMGFRGEALASIGSVARLEIRSCAADQDSGGLIVVDHGVAEPPQPAACPPGTRIRVSGLFERVPARRKFLKSAQAETNRTRRVVRDIAAANPEVAFVLASNGRTLLDLPANDPRSRLEAVLGAELAEHMLEVSVQRDGIGLWGLIGRPELARPTAQHQIMCLNGRPIVDRSLRYAVREAFRGLMEPSRHPTAALFLSVPPDRVDVNVHPAKSEVRFRDDRLVFSIVKRGVEEALRGADIVPRFETSGMVPSVAPRERPLFGHSDTRPAGFDAAAARAVMASSPPQQTAEVGMIQTARPVLQIHRMFLVTEDAEGMLIIDQHALHERVMFERLLERIGEATLPSQRLLIPEMVETSPEAIEAMGSLGEMLGRLGFDVSPAGPATVAVHAVPSLLTERRVGIGAFMSDLLERAAELRDMTDQETALRDVLDMMACKAAIKAGEQLTERELADLLSMRETVERSSNCPHGRPTTLRLSIEELERRFGRR
ncbi:MAG: DNA mismatch repair endonuclease MutL [Phycisphaerales bacterium]|jgi:DNA mismatch repair protein MutL|nr:DNA mismatch repair endonuclease MutL [Phycisphaerales bacterium]MDP6311421.1 DNA mismatch repair endonuclease MutL [Phycisphaerales bacterium]MDP7188374.1 DNA mismatch repair endonuclease MutL [Phycisphaerales bacterium]MDP7518613.1 DNA mismatch repair endonuclease MutL [Phycisphaerales bacterium]